MWQAIFSPARRAVHERTSTMDAPFQLPPFISAPLSVLPCRLLPS